MLHSLLTPNQQHSLLFDPVPPSPVTSCGWGKLKGENHNNQDWIILAPNPVPVLCLEQLFNIHNPYLFFEFGNSSLKIVDVETALGKGKVKLSDLQEIFLQNHGCKWLTATVSEKSRSWDISSLEANPSTIAHKKSPKDSLRNKDHLPLFWYGEQIFF